MDGLGLQKYVVVRPKERIALRVELAYSLKYEPDPAMMVLDSLEGFCDENLPSVPRVRTAFVLLMDWAGVEIGPEAMERARSVAAEWKKKFPAAQSGGDGDGEEDGSL